jgi:ABC-type Mn2+/Zn2+ transport system ATPase subunit
MAEISASETIAAVLVTHNLQAIARCAERVLYLERKVRAWGLWDELSQLNALSAIHLAPQDHKHAELDSD